MSAIDLDELDEYIEAIFEEKARFLKIYDAVVMNNIDPLQGGRVQVMVPALGWVEPDKWIWALPEFPNKGSHFLS